MRVSLLNNGIGGVGMTSWNQQQQQQLPSGVVGVGSSGAGAVAATAAGEAPSSSSSSSSSDQHKFPERLHFVLSALEKDNQQDVMHWMPCGRCFLAKDKERMISEVLPNWFRQTRYSSFLRQLNMYGFKRIQTGPNKGSYWHPKFLRDQPELTKQIDRVVKRGKGHRPANTTPPTPEPAVSSAAANPSAGTSTSTTGTTWGTATNVLASGSSPSIVSPTLEVTSAPPSLAELMRIQNCAAARQPPAVPVLSTSSANIIFDRILLARAQQQQQQQQAAALQMAMELRSNMLHSFPGLRQAVPVAPTTTAGGSGNNINHHFIGHHQMHNMKQRNGE